MVAIGPSKLDSPASGIEETGENNQPRSRIFLALGVDKLEPLGLQKQ
jgi:hypothetical protein